jgi:hypothetical protein
MGAAHADISCKKISGSIKRGELFEASITEKLNLKLIPNSQGWDISINEHGSSVNFASITTPLRGPNATAIKGSNFRNIDNSGPNDIGPKNNNAPGEERWFRFATNETDYNLEWEDMRCAMGWGCTAGNSYEKVRASNPRLTIEGAFLNIINIKLGNTGIEHSSEPAWIDEMDFKVECNNKYNKPV